MNRPLAILSAVSGVFTPVLAGPKDPAPQMDSRPNVLFIPVDDLRPAIAAFGDPHAITPNLDRLVRSGAAFTQAYCQQAVCHPSRVSLLTGVRPDTTGIYDLVTPIRDRLPDVVTLPQLFRQAGYQVYGRGKVFHGKLDDPQSWDSAPAQGVPLKGTMYASPENRPAQSKVDLEDGKPKSRGPAFERADVPDNSYTDGILADEAIDLLKAFKENGRPFFLAVGFIKPHLPFNAPEKYWALYDSAKLWPPPNRSLPEGLPSWTSQPGWEIRNAYDVPHDYDKPLGEDLEKTLRHGYYAAVSYVDAQIGRVLDALDTEGFADNTIVVLWGDHGYHAGDLGTWCKHTNFEIAVHSPLIIRAPGFSHGEKINRPVEFLDVYPTLVDLCGLSAPPHLEGESLVPLLRDPDSGQSKGYAFSQYPRGGPKTGNPMMGYSVRKGHWRYTEWLRTDNGKVTLRELYDLEADPHITRNLAKDPDHAQTVSELSALLNHAGQRVPTIRSAAEQ